MSIFDMGIKGPFKGSLPRLIGNKLGAIRRLPGTTGPQCIRLYWLR